MTNPSPLGLRAIARRRLSILAVALVACGCAAPAAELSQDPSASATDAAPTTTQSASTTPTAPAETTSPTPEPTPVPSGSLAFEAPDGFLPPNSVVVVVVDALQLRDVPGLAAAVTGLASAGDLFTVQQWFGPIQRDGLDWYRLGPATAGDVDAWAAAGSGADRYLELVPPSCPSGEPDLATLVDMTSEWDRLSCFGDRSLTIEGTYGCPEGCGGTAVGDFEPTWLAYPISGGLLWPDYPSNTGNLAMRFKPEGGTEPIPIPIPNGSIVRVTGHFSDAASTTCTMSTFEGEQATPVDPRTAELYCRERFVVDSFEVLGTDPDFHL